MGENILKELCSRLLKLFKQTEEKEENAKDVACNRLRVVLMQDRTNLTPELLQRMRHELVELLSKYVEMDKDALELNFDQEEGGQMALMLSIPVIRAKDEAEIEEALKTSKQEEEDVKENEDDNDEISGGKTGEPAETDENLEEDDVSEDEKPEHESSQKDDHSDESKASKTNQGGKDK